MKIITIETLKAFLDELNKKYGTEFYTKQEIDKKLKELSKTSGYTQEKADAMMKEIARRIPNYQYEVKLTQKPHQTITATAGDKTYTDTFLIERGATVNFAIKPNPGYIAGTLSKIQLTIKEDVEVTVTDAMENPEIEAGSLEIVEDRTRFQVPAQVHILQASFGNAIKYIKVNPGGTVYFEFSSSFNPPVTIGDTKIGGGFTLMKFSIVNGYSYKTCDIWNNKDELTSDTGTATISWSKEINEHATDIDFTGRY